MLKNKILPVSITRISSVVASLVVVSSVVVRMFAISVEREISAVIVGAGIVVVSVGGPVGGVLGMGPSRGLKYILRT